MDGFIPKPIDFRKCIGLIESLIGRRESG
jgi:hypothetical protein